MNHHHRRFARAGAGLLLALGLAACGDEGHSHEGDHTHDDAHTAPHGGVLVELGDHAANVELLLDAEAGTLTLYALGPHAEEPVRVAAPSVAVAVDLPDGPATLDLAAVARELTGETVGDSSEFRVTDPRLVGLAELSGTIPTIAIRGAQYTDVAFPQEH